MTRSSRWTSMLIATGAMLGSGCATSRVPAARLATAPTAERCTAEVGGMDVRDWRQIRADGFTFCAPASWSRNERFDRSRARQTATGFAGVSWAGPDTTQRVVFTRPVEDDAVERTRTWFTNCLKSSRDTRRVGDQDVCFSQSLAGPNVPSCPNGFVEVPRTDPRLPIKESTICPAGTPRDWAAGNVRVVYGQPLVQVTVFGFEEALAVAQTVRPIAGAP